MSSRTNANAPWPSASGPPSPLPARSLPWVLGVSFGVALAFGLAGLLALLVTLMLFAWLRSRFLARLGGTTGDTAGALVELTECAVLVALAL